MFVVRDWLGGNVTTREFGMHRKTLRKKALLMHRVWLTMTNLRLFVEGRVKPKPNLVFQHMMTKFSWWISNKLRVRVP